MSLPYARLQLERSCRVHRQRGVELHQRLRHVARQGAGVEGRHGGYHLLLYRAARRGEARLVEEVLRGGEGDGAYGDQKAVA